MKALILGLLVMTASVMTVGVTDVSAAEQTWTGKISDSNCGATHKMAGKTDRECTEACIKGGAKYVFVSDGNVYKIQNQDFAGLPVHAGHTVTLKGEMNGDTITVSTLRCLRSPVELQLSEVTAAALVVCTAMNRCANARAVLVLSRPHSIAINCTCIGRISRCGLYRNRA